jgi:hypothetical protein
MPPILLESCALKTLKDCPVAFDLFDDPHVKEAAIAYLEVGSTIEWGGQTFVSSVVHYLDGWAYGGDITRALP